MISIVWNHYYQPKYVYANIYIFNGMLVDWMNAFIYACSLAGIATFEFLKLSVNWIMVYFGIVLHVKVNGERIQFNFVMYVLYNVYVYVCVFVMCVAVSSMCANL